MKRFKKLRSISLMLAAILLFSAVACDTDASEDPTTAPATTTAATTEKETEKETDAPDTEDTEGTDEVTEDPGDTTEPDDTDPPSGDSLVHADVEALEPVVLDWYIGQNPMPDNEMVNDAVNEYLKEKINATVTIRYWTYDEFQDKMGTMLSSGQDAGIVTFGSQSGVNYTIYGNTGAFAPMDELLEEYAPETKALFSDEVWDSMRINGDILGVPSLKDNCYIISLIYNADLAEDLGIDMENLEFDTLMDLEDEMMEWKELRDAKYPEISAAGIPLSANIDRETPYFFSLETYLNESFVAVSNVPPYNDVAAFDDKEVFNFYETDEYREFAQMKSRMVQNGIFAYDYTDKSEWNYTGDILTWAGWGYTYMQEHLYGENFTTKMVRQNQLWTETGNYHSAGAAISSQTPHPERAMMLLNLINNDPEFATMMRFGIEDQHYLIDETGDMTFEGSPRNGGERADWGYYYWYGAPIGNLTIVNAPESMVGPNDVMLTEIIKANEDAAIPSNMGFVLDTDPINTEVAATTNTVLKYRTELRNGRFDSPEAVDAQVDAFIAELKANGADKIVEETQRQIDEWRAGQ